MSRSFIALSVVLSFSAVLASRLDASEISKPNIIVTYTDDQGYGDFSATNPDCRLTPFES